ncbi:MAG TPA: LssY C-terminal domain-containing protein [Bryobacteraceae bacterium]|nr:LssY C-terminal domain-containing protein [Bryobacteraceae bacterium]
MLSNFVVRIGVLLALAAAQVSALQLPAGTEVQIRLKSKLSSKTSRQGDAVDAEVIAPVMAASVYAIPAGAAIHGTVEQVQPSSADQRALLLLQFNRLAMAGASIAISVRLAAVDNARETVGDRGEIVGILVSETSAGKIDSEVGKLGDRLGGLGTLLGRATKAVTNRIDPDITYDVGVEMTLRLTAPAVLSTPGGSGPLGRLKPVPDRAALVALAAAEPFQTVAQNPPKNSDLTNLMLIGDRPQVEKAFADALWHPASSLSPVAKFETIEALAEDRGYSEAPVSVLLLEGKPPDIVFEKLNDTFARRHHLRIWLRPGQYDGRLVWVVAATHDMGISFSEANRTFIHRIDSSIDRERDKVVSDLIYSGHVASMLLVDRAAIPQHAQNATGDNLVTDGKIAVLVLQ